MSEQWISAQAREDWTQARRKAFWSTLRDFLLRRPRELMPFEAVKSRINIRGSLYRGLQNVPLDQIVGSEGRYADFDRRFLPLQEQTKGRWQSVDIARYQDKPLPPVDLYKLGNVYFVKDGNHRVSVARQLGQSEIDAYVTEYEVDVPLEPNLAMRDLLIKEEYSDFLFWTDLARLRPEQRIELSALGGYLELIQHINTHRYYLGQERNREITTEEAVTSWYDNVYKPVVDTIRQHNILQAFPGRSEADLYLWIMKHRSDLLEFGGVDPGAEASVLDYATKYRKRGVLESLGETVQLVREAAQTVGKAITPPLELLDFVQWSGLDYLCPDANVRLSNVADYERLRQHIVDHQYYLAKEQARDVPLSEAVGHWCQHLYMPTLQAIRQQQALQHFPNHDESDLFLWISDDMHVRKEEGINLDPHEAVKRFVEKYGNGNEDGKGALATLLQRARRLVCVD